MIQPRCFRGKRCHIHTFKTVVVRREKWAALEDQATNLQLLGGGKGRGLFGGLFFGALFCWVNEK